MKKICLSIDQMRQLKELGVETKDASMVLMFFTEDGEELSWDQVENHGKDRPLWEWFNEETEIWEPAIFELFDPETGSYDHSYREECGVFTLQDMLEMMPIYIDKGLYSLELSFDEVAYTDKPVYTLQYIDAVRNVSKYSVEKENLIDTVFDMLIWLAKHGYLKGGNK